MHATPNLPSVNRADPMSEKIAFAVIGGSGLYSIPGLVDVREINIETPFGSPSAPVVLGTLEGKRIAFLARHGIGHHISPTEVNYRANILALKTLGVRRIVSISACGSLREDYAPGHIVIPDQIFDYTHLRPRSFFGNGMVAHISGAEPFCSDLSKQVHDAVRKTSAIVHLGGSLITIEGPRFSTKAESNIFRSWGISIIGMTASPEAFLAREAEMCYSTMAHVTDYDVWHVSAEPVSVDIVIQTLNQNTRVAQDTIREMAISLKEESDCSCGNALASAVITNPTAIPSETLKKLDLLVGKYFQQKSSK
jgi:5'-methylthioadenosine phosphorylase